MVPDSLDEDSGTEIFPMLNKVASANNSGTADDTDGSDDPDDEVITRDETNKKIYIVKVIKSSHDKTGRAKKSSRVYNSVHYCPYCKTAQTNFSHHILSKSHQKEEEVAQILKLDPEKSSTRDDKEKVMKERKKKIGLLRLRGDHLHNQNVLSKKRGQLLLTRRHNGKLNISDYGPCPRCLEWVKLKMLRRHKCLAKQKEGGEMSNSSLVVQSQVITNRIEKTASKALREEVFTVMQSDETGQMARNDKLIIHLGNQCMLQNMGNKIMRRYYTSGVMRLAAKLNKQLQILTQEKKDMEHFICPRYFDQVAKAALLCAKQDASDDEELGSPSNAIKLGFHLKKMASAKLGLALVEGDDVKYKQTRAFMELMDINWSLQVTKLGKVVLSERAFNRSYPLPLPSDVKKLAEFLIRELTTADYTDR